MARLFSSGFELNTDTSGMEFSTVSVSGGGVNSSVVRSGSYSMNIVASGGARYCQYQFPNAQGAYYLRTYINFSVFPIGSTTTIAVFESATSTRKLSVRCTSSSGQLTLYNEEDGAQVGSNSATLSTGTWYMLELFIDTTTLSSTSVEAKIDGTSFASGTIDLLANVQYFRLGTYGTDASIDIYYDDVALNDTSGSSETGYPGEGKLVLALPTGAGDNAADTGIYSYINEIPPTDTATSGSTMIELDTTTSIGDYNMTDSATLGIASPDTIKFVAPMARVREETSGASNYTLRVKSASGATVSSSSSVDAGNTTPRTNPSGGTAFANRHVVYLDPTTGVAWTATGTNSIDNMQVGVATTDGNPDTWVLWLGAYIEYVEVPPALAETLTDNFDDNSIDAKWTTSDSGSSVTSETNSQIEMALPSSATSADYASLRSVDTYDLTSSYAYVKITQAVSDTTAANQTLTLYIDATHYVRWVIESGTIYAQWRDGGGNTTVFSDTFDISTHTWWRISESAGDISWDTSADGDNWTNRGSYTTGLAITSMYAYLEAYTYQNETNPGTAIFDNFNVVPSAPSGSTKHMALLGVG